MGSGINNHLKTVSNHQKCSLKMSASHGNIASKQSKSTKQRHTSFNSDNGGFEVTEVQNSPVNSRSSQHISVRERLRSSFDKLSFKSFIWGSSEKVCSNKNTYIPKVIGPSSSKKKSDKNQVFKNKLKTKIEMCNENVSLKQKKKDKFNLHKVLANRKINKTQLKLEKKVEQQSSNIASSFGFETNNLEETLVDQQSSLTNKSKKQKRIVSEHPVQVKSVKTNKSCKEKNEAYLTVSSDYSDLNRVAAITRAKENWSTLRENNQNRHPPRYGPVKASSKFHQPVFYVAGSSSMDVLPSSETAECIKGNKAVISKNYKLVPNHNMVVNSSSSINLSTKNRSPMIKQNFKVHTAEPPKIAPVSGMYLPQNPLDPLVLRPTAFKVVAKRNKIKKPLNDCNALPKFQNKTANQDINYSQRKSSASDSNSDSGLLCSGRNSSDSNEVTNGTTKTSQESSSNEAYISANHNRKSANNVFVSTNKNFTTEFNDVQKYDSYVVEKLSSYSNYKLENKILNKDEKQCEEPKVSPKQAQMETRHHSKSKSADRLNSMEKRLMRLNAEIKMKNAENDLIKSKCNDLFSNLQTRELELQNVILRLDEKEFDYNELQQRVDLLESGGQNDDKYRHEQFAWPAEREEFLNRISLLESRLVEQNRQFDAERQQWIEDKSRVVRYQKQLQDNYMSLYKRSRDIEQENTVLANKLRQFSTANYRQERLPVRDKGLSYPMDI